MPRIYEVGVFKPNHKESARFRTLSVRGPLSLPPGSEDWWLDNKVLHFLRSRQDHLPSLGGTRTQAVVEGPEGSSRISQPTREGGVQERGPQLRASIAFPKSSPLSCFFWSPVLESVYLITTGRTTGHHVAANSKMRNKSDCRPRPPQGPDGLAGRAFLP